ncbi:GYMNOS family protein [Hibiscus syriacus]|uniref:GYMNOS family protein n=1 Tax=Hibiscus syriacus TaxID=106335 RepID=A0A6A2XEB8_HIBSY|nr:GYMNOS family protein [Hibiscus syriacus]
MHRLVEEKPSLNSGFDDENKGARKQQPRLPFARENPLLAAVGIQRIDKVELLLIQTTITITSGNIYIYMEPGFRLSFSVIDTRWKLVSELVAANELTKFPKESKLLIGHPLNPFQFPPLTPRFSLIFTTPFSCPNPPLSSSTSPLDQQKLPEFRSGLSAKYPPVKTILSIGGGGNNPDVLARMARTEETRGVFINSTIEEARGYQFDGVDLDWEFPATGDDMANLALLFKEWREALQKEAETGGKPRLLLTSAVYYSSEFTNYGLPRTYPAHAWPNN